MRRKGNLITGLDIGTTKVCAIVGEDTDHGIEIIGIGTAPSKGLRKGVVINIEDTVSAIRRAIEDAELMAGCSIQSAYVGIAGGHIKSMNSHGVVAIKDREVSEQDIVRVMDAAQTIAIPMDREIIHIIPQEYIVDEQDGIRDPRGMAGVRLSTNVHIVTGAVSSTQNVIKCCHKMGVSVKDLVLEQLASSEAVLTLDEKELGVLLVDIGGGTTDIAVFFNGAIQHTAVLSLGGDHITRDIAIGLGVASNEAENIKQKYGCAVIELINQDEIIDISGVSGRKNRTVSKRLLSEIIEPRVEEIFSLVATELTRAGMASHLSAGVVITGGSMLLDGMTEMAERVFGMSVRIGIPHGISGLIDEIESPIFSTAVGLMLFGRQNESFEEVKTRPREDTLYSRFKNRMGGWIGQIF